jgi:hypothetical protein
MKQPGAIALPKSGKVIRKERLGGLLNYYERLAA